MCIRDSQWYAHKAGSERDLYQYIPFSQLEMDEYSRLLPDPERFPSSVQGAGFRPLAEYVDVYKRQAYKRLCPFP